MGNKQDENLYGFMCARCGWLEWFYFIKRDVVEENCMNSYYCCWCSHKDKFHIPINGHRDEHRGSNAYKGGVRGLYATRV